MLAPGDYKISIAIWDKNETLAFDYHYGYHELIVTGPDNKRKELLNMPFKIKCSNVGHRFTSFFRDRNAKPDINPDLLTDKISQIKYDNIKIEHIKFLDHNKNKKDIFMTNEGVKFDIKLAYAKPASKDLYLWAGIYRDDGVYCQGITAPLCGCMDYGVVFPEFSLLPGIYSISVGVWDTAESKFLTHHHGIYPFKMVFDKQDHGTVFMEHKWRWEGV